MQVNEVTEQLIRRYSELLTGFCYSLCKNPHDAQDLFQETWLKLLKSDFVFRDERGFVNYLLHICVNAYKDVFNARKRRSEELFDDEKLRYIESIPDKAGRACDTVVVHARGAECPRAGGNERYSIQRKHRR